jgi:hypothetical protein
MSAAARAAGVAVLITLAPPVRAVTMPVTAQPDLIRTIVALGRDWQDSPDLPYTVDAEQQARCGDVLLDDAG